MGEGQHAGQQLGRVAQDLKQARHDLQRVAEDEDEHDYHGDSGQPGSWLMHLHADMWVLCHTSSPASAVCPPLISEDWAVAAEQLETLK